MPDSKRGQRDLIMPATSLLGTIYQVGVVVSNLESGMASYSRLFGLTHWKRLDTDYIGRYRDWQGRIANRNAFAAWGDIHLEIIEPVIGQANAMEWLETRGEGIFHLGVAVDDVRQRTGDAEVVFEVISRPNPMAALPLCISIRWQSWAISPNSPTGRLRKNCRLGLLPPTLASARRTSSSISHDASWSSCAPNGRVGHDQCKLVLIDCAKLSVYLLDHVCHQNAAMSGALIAQRIISG